MKRLQPKQRAGESAAELVRDGMVIGLGTGSTAEFAIRRIGERMRSESLEVLGVPTSIQAEISAIKYGIPLSSLSEHPSLDLCIDGADQVDSDLNLIKGYGGAHTREKIIAHHSKKLVIVVDELKLVDSLSKPVPLEVLPYARKPVENNISDLGGIPRLRIAERKDGPVITDDGNILIDADLGLIKDPEKLAKQLSEILGVIGHGIFTKSLVSMVYIGKKDRTEIKYP